MGGKSVASSIDQLIDLVSMFLPDFLQEHGIDPRKHFRCLDPQHDDQNPSCSMLPNRRAAYCHGCHQTFNIFRAASLLEGRPYTGPGFVSDNLLVLAQRYGIDIQDLLSNEENSYILEVKRAYQDTAQCLMQQPWPDMAIAEMQRRQWRTDILQQLLVGAIAKPQDFFNSLLQLGYEEDFLREIALLPPKAQEHHNIFNNHSLIFTLCDPQGRAVGFAARDLLYGQPGHKNKYYNTSSLPKYDICRKSERLYNLHLAKRATPPLYLVEGYADVVSLYHHGIKNAVALGGTNLTETMLDILNRHQIFDLILALDGDKAGQEQAARLVEKHIGKRHFRLQILELPAGQDPDDLLRSGGAEAWKNLVPLDVFAWYLDRFSWETSPDEICEKAVPLIAREASAIRREYLSRLLASRTGFTLASIISEVEKQVSGTKADHLAKLEAIIESGMNAAKRLPQQAELILMQTLAQVQSVNAEYGQHMLGIDECLLALQTQAQKEREKPKRPETFRLGPALEPLSSSFEGSDLFTSWIIVGGSGNVGKTNLVCQLAAEIAIYDPDAVVILHSIDDARERIITRLARHALGKEAGNIALNWLKNPHHYSNRDATLMEKHRLAYQRLSELVKREKLIPKGLECGTSLTAINYLIDYYRQRLPEVPILYILDNFHLVDRINGERDNERLAATTREFKRILQRHRCTAITTVEYTKLPPAVRPSNHNIYGSVQFEYEADVIIHLYNQLHGLGADATLYHFGANGQQLPTVELIFGKNKINDFKGIHYLDMHPEQGRYTWISPMEVERRRAAVMHEREAQRLTRELKKPNNGNGGQFPTKTPHRSTQTTNSSLDHILSTMLEQ